MLLWKKACNFVGLQKSSNSETIINSYLNMDTASRALCAEQNSKQSRILRRRLELASKSTFLTSWRSAPSLVYGLRKRLISGHPHTACYGIRDSIKLLQTKLAAARSLLRYNLGFHRLEWWWIYLHSPTGAFQLLVGMWLRVRRHGLHLFSQKR